jgi:PKD repeat protein
MYRSVTIALLLVLLILPVCANIVAVGNVSALVFQGSYISIDAVGTRHPGDKITITATTDLPVGSLVLFEVYPSPNSLTRIGTAGEYSGASGTVAVYSMQNGNHNLLGFPVDLSTFQPGVYTIRATAFDNDITGSGQFTVAPTVTNTLPLALFTYKPDPAIVNEPVVFDGTGSRDPDGKILTYQWDFGDDTAPSGEARPSHTYPSTGLYRVTLKVMDDNQQFGQASDDVNVVAPIPPVADFSMSPSTGQAYENHPFAVSLSDKSTGSPLTWAWYVDDTLVSQLPTYSQSIFTKPGNYTIRLVVTNGFGTSEKKKTVTIKPFYPTTTPVTVIPTSQSTTTITTVATTPVVPCSTCDPCLIFGIPCLWIDIFVIIIVIVVAGYIWTHRPQTPQPPQDPPQEPLKISDSTEPQDPPPPEVTIEARGGILPRGLDLTNLDIHVEVEAGIKHHDKEE